MTNCQECDRKANYGFKKDKIKLYCSTHKKNNMYNMDNRVCEYEDCIKQATYGYINTKQTRCKDHHLNNMMDVKNKKCEHPGCNTRAGFNDKDKKKSKYCKKHCDELFGCENTMDLTHKKCEYNNCKNRAYYNYKDEKTPKYCIDHRLSDMQNKNIKYCLYKNCNIIPVFGYENTTIKLYYSLHKHTNMINLHAKICEYYGCNKQAGYNYLNLPAIYCSEHKKKDMIAVRINYCVEQNCNKMASYNIKTEHIPLYCNLHKKNNMINITKDSEKCNECDKRGIFGYSNNKSIKYCKDHKKIDMIDIVHKLCLECPSRAVYGTHIYGLIHCDKHVKRSKEWKINKCLNDFCKNMAICSENGNYPFIACDNCNVIYKYNFKSILYKQCKKCGINNMLVDDDGNCLDICSKNFNIRLKYSENQMKNFFDINNIIYNSYDKIIDNSCLKVRPDFVFDLDNLIIIVENDENQHKTYECECEQKRMINIYESYGGTPVHFIRFNPDNYVSKNKLLSSLSHRHKKLLDVINSIKNNKNFYLEYSKISVQYLYYDNYDENAGDNHIININY